MNNTGKIIRAKELILKWNLYVVSISLLMGLFVLKEIDFSVFAEGINGNTIVRFIYKNFFCLLCIGVILLGIIGYKCFKYQLTNAKELPVEIEQCKNINYENLSFLATYIIPLVCFPHENSRDLLVLFIVILVIGCIYVRTNQYYTNPSLLLLGFNVYSVNCKNSNGFGCGIVIVRGKLKNEDKIIYLSLSDNVYYARRITR